MKSSSTHHRRISFLTEMGLGPVWIRRDAPNVSNTSDISVTTATAQTVPTTSTISVNSEQTSIQTSVQKLVPSTDIANMDWAQLKASVAQCTACNLCKTRTKTVLGIGDEQAEWLFIGEGPGRKEDAQGEPFVGPAGKLLNNMMLAMNLQRGTNTYIANIVKCRPTNADGNDRPPTPEEAAACKPYLDRQIALLQAKIIVALGKTAAISLLNQDPQTSVSTLRGKVHRYVLDEQKNQDIPLLVTYHPAYLLRRLVEKAKTWADLCLAITTYKKQKPSLD